MAKAIQIRMGGYGPATTGFSRSLKFIGDRLMQQLGDRVAIKYVWNIMDFGYRAEDILWLVEHGLLTLGYQSSSYLTDRVPELGIADLPFLFESNEEARAAIDGRFGGMLIRKIEQRVDYRILGFFENGFRQVSNRLRPVHMPADLAGMRIRVLPSKIQARTFELLGAVPLMWDLTEALAAIKAGTIDAQENPFANTVTYGAHKFHRFHTITNHFYVSRPIFVHGPSFDAYPKELQEAFRAAAKDAVAFQRGLAVEEDSQARCAIAEAGCEIVALSSKEHAAFRDAVNPIYGEARRQYDKAALELASARLVS
jgi:tripartite ATP-independent transporter DctP family solute receptor